MALTNSQYNTLLRDYDARQFASRRKLDQRTAEIYATIDGFEELNQELISNSMECARLSLFDSNKESNKERLDRLQSSNLDISMRKIELLVEHGYPADYLSPVYQCKDCKDTGFIANKRCHCFKQAVIQLLYTESFLNRALDNENFDNFRYDFYSDTETDAQLGITPYNNILRVVDKCRSFIDGFKYPYNQREHKNLLIYGNTGVGKTFLANCIAREILNQSHSVVYITATELFDIITKKTFDKDNNFELQGKAEYIDTCDLLIIDDLGTELSNSLTNSQLYSCLNNRMLKNLPVIISTNYQLNELQIAYSERIFSRLIGEYTILRILGEDIRIKQV